MTPPLSPSTGAVGVATHSEGRGWCVRERVRELGVGVGVERKRECVCVRERESEVGVGVGVEG